MLLPNYIRIPASTLTLFCFALVCLLVSGSLAAGDNVDAIEFFESKVRPLLITHCYECHSEESGEQQGGLLLDRKSGWMDGGDTGKAVLPGEPDASPLVTAVRYDDDDLQMPPDGRLSEEDIQTLTRWVSLGAPGAKRDLGDTEFSRLGDQAYLFAKAIDHWAFQPVEKREPPEIVNVLWQHPIDRFVFDRLAKHDLVPSRRATAATLARRLHFDLTGLPPTYEEIRSFEAAMDKSPSRAVAVTVDRLMSTPSYGEHVGRMWLDVVRYADTDSAYRPDTKTPHYFPYAFTYRDYVTSSFNEDKPFNAFIEEQFAADLKGFGGKDPEMAALGFWAVGPHASRSVAEAYDDWIDLTTRGLMGLTVACARCHDHKYEPVPTADYYSLRGVFASITRVNPLDERRLPEIEGYEATASDQRSYELARAAVDKKVAAAGDKKSGGNNRSVAQKIRETELAQLMLHHPGAPVRAMIVTEAKRPAVSYVLIRGDNTNRGAEVPRRFLKVLEPSQAAFSDDSSGRLELSQRITDPKNPLTARVYVNRIWGMLMGSHLVNTPSDFGLQGARPTHPALLDWLAFNFVEQGWSTKQLIRLIVTSQTYQQASQTNAPSHSLIQDSDKLSGLDVDPENRLLWRANRKHLSIEAIRDSILSVAGQLDRRYRGRSAPLWGKDYTRRRALYGYINRFNLDPTLRAFDFPSPMQTQPRRSESIVAPQALFTLNSPFVIEQADAIIRDSEFESFESDQQRAEKLFQIIFARNAHPNEVSRILKFIEYQARFDNAPKNRQTYQTTWSAIAQAMLMSNELQYLD